MKVVIAIIFVVVMGGYIFYVGLKEFENRALTSADKISFSFKKAGSSLLGFNPAEALSYFLKIKEEISLLQSQLPAFTNFIPLLRDLPPVFSNINELTEAASQLTEKLDFLKREGAQLVINQKGPELIKTLEAIKTDLRKVNRLTTNLKIKAAELNFDLGKEITGISHQLYTADNFLNSFIGWLKADEPRHLVIMFQNPSEIRPAGGFTGSFAHLTIDKGSLINLEVQDIYDFDGQLNANIIPPYPLQAITTDWEARDANWFFDYPASAKKFIQLLELSKIYEERRVSFSGALAINTNVINDILKIIGPIELADRQLSLNDENFLSEIQRNVETEKNKSVLKEATPILFEKIGKLSDEQKKMLAETIKFRLENKDVMIYLNDLILNSYLKDLRIGGEIITLAEDFFGEYLAVVNANIAGGKSDAFISQKIKLASQVDNSGEINNQLEITRKHSGENEKDEWYRALNQNFIQLLTPLGSKLVSIEGDDEKIIKPAIDYQAKKYKTDPDIKEIENGDEQFGKTYFSTWFNVPAGKEKTLVATYRNPKKFDLISGLAEQKYSFIFEKQSGVESGLEFSIEAPAGFKWKESDSPVFSYQNINIPGRLIVNLTLQ